MLDWIKNLRYTKEQKRKIKYLEEIIETRMNTPSKGFDETLLVSQYNLAELYAKNDKEKATKLLRKSIHEYYVLILEENQKTLSLKFNLTFEDEEQMYQRELALDKIKNYENRLLNLAQKIEKNPELFVRDIAFGTNKLLHTEMTYAIKKVLKEQKLCDLDQIVKETKHDWLIKYANNKDILDKKNLYLYS